MYKIQFLLVLALACPPLLFGQSKGEQPANRQASFTAHLLTDQVEPGKKHEYERLIEGQKVSLPYPTPFQHQQRWPIAPPTFRLSAGS